MNRRKPKFFPWSRLSRFIGGTDGKTRFLFVLCAFTSRIHGILGTGFYALSSRIHGIPMYRDFTFCVCCTFFLHEPK